MTRQLSQATLERLDTWITARLGLRFVQGRLRDLDRGIRAAAREFGFGDPEACIDWMLSAPLTQRHIETLASYLTVGETYFFRDGRLFGALESIVLPELIRARREHGRSLRIWSAACSTGEEPYSVAILLDRLIPDLDNWSITILATDINPSFLRIAALGKYGEWSFRAASPAIRDRYFTQVQSRTYAISERIKEMVTFAYLNLAEDTYPTLVNNTNAIDVILCRNVLMYFAQASAAGVVEKLCRSLCDGGWLLVSPGEMPHARLSGLIAVNGVGAAVYRKQGRTSRPQDSNLIRPVVLDNRDTRLCTSASSEIQPVNQKTIDVHEAQPAPPNGPMARVSPGEPPADSGAQSAGDSGSNLYEQAANLYARGQYTDAMALAVEFHTRNTRDASGMSLLARICANEGKLADALAWCEQALSVDRLTPSVHYLHAVILAEHGRHDEAVAALGRTLYLDSAFVLAHIALAEHARRLGRSGDAARHRRNALALLAACDADHVIPESDGMTAGRLATILESAALQETPA